MDKNALLSPSEVVGTTDVDISAGTVKIRPLSRAEALAFANKEIDATKLEQQVLSKTMVEPEMTAKDIETWQKVRGAAGDIQKVFDTVVRISGMESDSAKSAYKSAGS